LGFTPNLQLLEVFGITLSEPVNQGA
jgi:hypothetical protein